MEDVTLLHINEDTLEALQEFVGDPEGLMAASPADLRVGFEFCVKDEGAHAPVFEFEVPRAYPEVVPTGMFACLWGWVQECDRARGCKPLARVATCWG